MAAATLPQIDDPLAEILAQTPSASAEQIAEALFAAEVRASAEVPLRRPGATYRLQLHKDFRLDDVTRIVDYLAELGITDCYYSPFLHARPGSTHGYDVFDHSRINPEIGDEPAHEQMVARLRARAWAGCSTWSRTIWGSGSPTGSGSTSSNLGRRRSRHGSLTLTGARSRTCSRAASSCRSWRTSTARCSNRAFSTWSARGSFWIQYHQHCLPLSPRSYARVLDLHANEFQVRFDPTDEDVSEYLSIREAVRHLPERTSTTPVDLEHVRREKEIIKRRVARLCAEPPAPRIPRRERRVVPGDRGRLPELRRAARAAGEPGLPAGLLAGRL